MNISEHRTLVLLYFYSTKRRDTTSKSEDTEICVVEKLQEKRKEKLEDEDGTIRWSRPAARRRAATF